MDHRRHTQGWTTKYETVWQFAASNLYNITRILITNHFNNNIKKLIVGPEETSFWNRNRKIWKQYDSLATLYGKRVVWVRGISISLVLCLVGNGGGWFSWVTTFELHGVTVPRKVSAMSWGVGEIYLIRWWRSLYNFLLRVVWSFESYY